MTSGTSGPPKLVVHSLASLAGAIGPALPGAPMVWGTFYDIRRYGGLQILLRAVLGARMFVLRDFDRPLAEYLLRLKQHRATHILGTPSHWRQALQLPESGGLSPTYLRLSGEICDQAILDRLRHAFPQSQVTHAYASTEAGVGFEVGDGRDGFPAALVGSTSAGVELRVIDGSLRIRSDRVAQGYLPQGAQALRDADGFFDSGDMLELSGDRYHFVGRRNGVINVGGLKVHPEEVEAVLNRHPEVQVSLVRARKSPVLGQLVVADVVPRRAACEELRESILATCRDMLPRHKVPVALRFVPSLDLSAGGKLARRDA
jgi:acyl-CoA synthetase (AMP-forming)/AMP-acid ligase II